MSSGLPDGQEHSMNITDRVSGIFGAAMRHTSIVRGLEAMVSGSTSPKKRNSWEVGSWRTKKADDS